MKLFQLLSENILRNCTSVSHRVLKWLPQVKPKRKMRLEALFSSHSHSFGESFLTIKNFISKKNFQKKHRFLFVCCGFICDRCNDALHINYSFIVLDTLLSRLSTHQVNSFLLHIRVRRMGCKRLSYSIPTDRDGPSKKVVQTCELNI